MGGGADGGSGGNDFEFGIDPSIDPELALALRMSMDEEKARVEKQNKAEQDAAKASLGDIKEEEEGKPLLNKDGEASGDKKDDDRMDTE